MNDQHNQRPEGDPPAAIPHVPLEVGGLLPEHQELLDRVLGRESAAAEAGGTAHPNLGEREADGVDTVETKGDLL